MHQELHIGLVRADVCDTTRIKSGLSGFTGLSFAADRLLHACSNHLGSSSSPPWPYRRRRLSSAPHPLALEQTQSGASDCLENCCFLFPCGISVLASLTAKGLLHANMIAQHSASSRSPHKHHPSQHWIALAARCHLCSAGFRLPY